MPTEAMVAEAVKAVISRGVKDIVKFKKKAKEVS